MGMRQKRLSHALNTYTPESENHPNAAKEKPAEKIDGFVSSLSPVLTDGAQTADKPLAWAGGL